MANIIPVDNAKSTSKLDGKCKECREADKRRKEQERKKSSELSQQKDATERSGFQMSAGGVAY